MPGPGPCLNPGLVCRYGSFFNIALLASCIRAMGWVHACVQTCCGCVDAVLFSHLLLAQAMLPSAAPTCRSLCWTSPRWTGRGSSPQTQQCRRSWRHTGAATSSTWRGRWVLGASPASACFGVALLPEAPDSTAAPASLQTSFQFLRLRCTCDV